MSSEPRSRFSLDELAVPIVGAPLAGGPSTPALALAVTNGGGLGFLAGGYLDVAALAADIEEVRRGADGPFGVNLFAPPGPGAEANALRRYAESLRPEAERYGVELGEPRRDDDQWGEKLALVCEAEVPVVSITFGCPGRETVERLHRAGVALWVTVTTPGEGELATRRGADALVAQGVEAGGHRGSFDVVEPGELALRALLEQLREVTDLPLIAAGGIATGRDLAAVLVAGACAAQLGTAMLLSPEAGTSVPHREALARGDAPTALTRAFSGRLARGIENRFLREHSAEAPAAYPAVHHLTAPLRAAARARGDAEAINLWAGQSYSLSSEEPAAEIVRRVAREAQEALEQAAKTRKGEG